MFNRQKNNRSKYLTIALVVATVVVGFFAFRSWQNGPTLLGQGQIDEVQVPSNTNASVPARPTLERGEPDHLWIPDRNIDTPIIYISEEENNNDGHQAALAKGVVHYPDTVVPGEYGNPYIFGHSSDYFWKPGSYKQVFKPLIDVPVGTLVRITNHEGELFIYKIIETRIVGPKEVSALDQYNYERKMLTLQTSWPLNTALKRFLAIAELDPVATYGPAEQ